MENRQDTLIVDKTHSVAASFSLLHLGRLQAQQLDSK